MLERFVHWVSYEWVRGWEKIGFWHNIDKISDSLFLSSLPMRGNEEHLIKDVGAVDSHSMLVVSVVKNYENTETLLFMDPIRPDEWKKTFNVDQSEVKVDHKQIKMEDFGNGKDIDIRSAAEIVIEIQQGRLKNHSVLVHCKAGRTRSAMIVACVLAVYDIGQLPENMNKLPKELIDLAIDFIQKQRPQIKVHDCIKDTAEVIVYMVRDMLKGEPRTLKEKVDKVAFNVALKNIVMELNAYKNLLQYRHKTIEKTGPMFAKIKPVMRAAHIDKFTASMANEYDGSWIDHLMYQTGPIKELIDAEPYSMVVDGKDEDKKERANLIDQLKKDVVSLLCKNLGCSRDALEKHFSEEVKLAMQPF